MSKTKRKRIRVLVVDDSPFICKAITRMLQSDPMITVVGHAANGKDALWKISALNPDLVTLDIQMPVMDGIQTLKFIMQKFPRPVLMMSSLTKSGAAITLQALELGAFDFVDKTQCTQMDIHVLREELINKVKTAAQTQEAPSMDVPELTYDLLNKAVASAEVQVEPLRSGQIPVTPPLNWTFSTNGNRRYRAVLIGASTGGPVVLQSIISSLPVNFPVGVVVVQHMPTGFTAPFAERLDKLCPVAVREAQSGDIVKAGTVLIAPSGKHLRFLRNEDDGQVLVKLNNGRDESIHVPSVDVMFDSGVQVYGDGLAALLLTGMGKDGAKGLKSVRNNGGLTVVQEERSCVVFGMPKAAIANGAASQVMPPHEMVSYICRKLGGEVFQAHSHENLA